MVHAELIADGRQVGLAGAQAVWPLVLVLVLVLALKILSDHRLAEMSGRRPQLGLTRKREAKDQRRSR